MKDAELKLAQQLIQQQSFDTFDPAEHVDEVKQRIEEAIARKVEGKEFTMPVERPETAANVIDLMDALRASLGDGDRAPARKTERKPARRAEAPAATPVTPKRRSSRR